MNLKELKTILEEYATEDVATCRERGAMCVTNTHIGNIWLTYENGVYRADSNTGTVYLEDATAEQVRELLLNNYSFDLK